MAACAHSSKGNHVTTLTESMTRLRDEILALRQNRQVLRAELRRRSSARHSEFQVWRLALLEELEGVRRVWAAPCQKQPAAPPPTPAEPVAQRLEAVPPEPLSAPAKAPPSIPPAKAANHVPKAQVLAAGTIPSDNRPAVSGMPLRIPREPVHPPEPDPSGAPVLATGLRGLWPELARQAHHEAEHRSK
jgi:hypothetical protein